MLKPCSGWENRFSLSLTLSLSLSLSLSPKPHLSNPRQLKNVEHRFEGILLSFVRMAWLLARGTEHRCLLSGCDH